MVFISDFGKNLSIAFIAVVLLFFVLKMVSVVFIPIAFSFLLFFLVSPIISYFKNKSVPSLIVIIGFVLCLLLIFSLFSFLFYNNAQVFISEFWKYEANLNREISLALDFIGAADNDIDWKSIVGIDSIKSDILKILNQSANVLWDFLLVILYTGFLLSAKVTFFQKLDKTVELEKARRIKKAFSRIEKDVQRYLYTKIVMGLLAGILCGSLMFIFGMDFVFLFAFMVLLFHFIPYIGPTIATLLPSSLMFLKHGFDVTFFAFILLFSIIQFTVGNILEPKISGDYLDLSPFLILISLVFWYWMWGIAGMFLAVPLLSLLKIILEHNESTRVLASFVGSK